MKEQLIPRVVMDGTRYNADFFVPFRDFDHQPQDDGTVIAPFVVGRKLNYLELCFADMFTPDKRASIVRAAEVTHVVLSNGKETIAFNVTGQPGSRFFKESVDSSKLVLTFGFVGSLSRQSTQANGSPLIDMVAPEEGCIVIKGVLQGELDLNTGEALFTYTNSGCRVLDDGEVVDDVVIEQAVKRIDSAYIALAPLEIK